MKLVPKHDKVLRQQAEPIVFDGEGAWSKKQLGRTVIMMLDTMYLKHGIGLAAPQVGIPKRIIVVDPLGERHQAKILINPEIWWRSIETEVDAEGCLSLPGEWGPVERAKHIKVTYYNQDGLREELDTGDDALLARVIQHEVDHLNGILFTDKLTQ